MYIYLCISIYIYKQLKRRKDELFHYILALRSVSPEGSSGTKEFSLLLNYLKENDVKPYILTINHNKSSLHC